MSLAVRFAAIPVQSIAYTSLGVGYMGVGNAVPFPIRQFLIQNLTDATLMFSFDGVNDHFPLPASGFFLNDISSNQTFNQGWYMAEGTRLYVREIGTPTTGTVYFSAFYGAV